MDVRYTLVSSECRESIGSDGPVREHTLTMMAEVENPNDARVNRPIAYQIMSSVFVPSLFSGHHEDPGARCRSRDCKQDNDIHGKFMLSIAYSTETPKQDDNPENPVEKRKVWSYQGNKITRIVTRDTDGKAVLTSALGAFDPPVEVPATIPVFICESNESTDPRQKKLDYEDKINSQAWKGAAKGTLRIAQIDANEATKSVNDVPTTYWKVTYRFEYNRDGWQPNPLSQDTSKLDEVGGVLKRVPIRDEQTKLPITTPIPLDNNGNPYSKEELEAGQAHYVKVKGYYEANFSLLGLD